MSSSGSGGHHQPQLRAARSSRPAPPGWRLPPTRGWHSAHRSGAPTASGPRTTRRKCGGPRGRSPLPLAVRLLSPPCRSSNATASAAPQGASWSRCRTPTPASGREFWVPHRLGGGAPTIAQAAELETAELAERPPDASSVAAGRRASSRCSCLTTVRRSVDGASAGDHDHLPGHGEHSRTRRAVVAIIRTSYVDCRGWPAENAGAGSGSCPRLRCRRSESSTS